jgi:hypothetical protein
MYEEAASGRGMTGVYELLTYQGNVPVDLWPVPHLVVDQLTAVRQARVISASEAIDLLPPGCGATDEPG